LRSLYEYGWRFPFPLPSLQGWHRNPAISEGARKVCCRHCRSRAATEYSIRSISMRRESHTTWLLSYLFKLHTLVTCWWNPSLGWNPSSLTAKRDDRESIYSLESRINAPSIQLCVRVDAHMGDRLAGVRIAANVVGYSA
jgi:hypothetical protein